MSESTDIHSKIEKMLNYLAEAFLHVKAVKIAQNQVRIGVTHVRHTMKNFDGKHLR